MPVHIQTNVKRQAQVHAQIKCKYTKKCGVSYFSHHPIPDVVDFLAMLAIGYQVKVIGELYIRGNLFQNVDAEAFAALLDICPPSLS